MLARTLLYSGSSSALARAQRLATPTLRNLPAAAPKAGRGYTSITGRSGVGNYVKDPVMAIIIANTGIFAAWIYSESEGTWQQKQFMRAHFTTSYSNCFDSGRIYTLATSAFSHRQPMHFLANMVGLYSFGYPVYHMLGSTRFLAMYSAGGIVGALAHSFTPFFIPSSWPTGGARYKRQSLMTPALGASGAISGVIAFYSMVNPRASVMLYYLLPMPVGLLAVGLVAFDAYCLYSGSSPGVGHACHIGGALTGATAFLVLRRRLF